MKDEEKAIEYCGCNQPICRKGFETKDKQNCTCARKKNYLDGFAEGEKTGKEKQWIATEKAQKKTSSKIKELEKENAELKEELHQKSDTNHSLVEQLADKDIKVAELEEQIEVKKLQILELKAQIGNMKCKNIYAVPDELLNSVPCYTVYDCKHCSKRS